MPAHQELSILNMWISGSPSQVVIPKFDIEVSLGLCSKIYKIGQDPSLLKVVSFYVWDVFLEGASIVQMSLLGCCHDRIDKTSENSNHSTEPPHKWENKGNAARIHFVVPSQRLTALAAPLEDT
eukprot:5662979-Amphidinium_carterae.1